MINFQYVRSNAVKTALSAVAKEPSATFIAGGTNLVDLMKRGVTSPSRLVDIQNLPLKQISLVNDVLHAMKLIG